MVAWTTAVSQGRSWAASIPDAAWGPLSAGLLILAVGGFGLVVGQPWLFPSLGPSAFLYVESPQLRTARFYNTVMGHLSAIGAAFFAVLILGATDAPSVLATGQLIPVRVWASVIAVVVTVLLVVLFRSSHPPAAATTLLISLGGFSVTVQDAMHIIVGVLIVGILGQFFRYLRLEE